MIFRLTHILACLLIYLNCYAQKGSGPTGGYAFYKIVLPGLNKMDEEGRSLSKPDTTFLIYMVIKGRTEPKIEKVICNHSIYQASITPINNKEVTVGLAKSSGKIMKITARTRETIWKIDLQMIDPDTRLNAKEYNDFKIIFQKRLHWKSFEIHASIELEAEEHN